MKACRLSCWFGLLCDVQYRPAATAVVARKTSTGASSGSRAGAPRSAELADGGAGTVGGPAQIIDVVQGRHAAGAQRRQQRVQLALEVGDGFATAAQRLLQAVAPQRRDRMRP